MLHSEIKHQSKEVTIALALAACVDDPDDIPLVVLLGVSGAGKTRTAYDIAKEQYIVYFEATTIHSGDLTAAIKKMKEVELLIPLPKDTTQIAASRDTFEARCELIIHRLILARVLTLLLLYGSGKVTLPSNWLLAQLNGGGTMSANIFNKLGDLIQGNQLSLVLGGALEIFKSLFGLKLAVITDEAHLLLNELQGAFRRPSYRRYSSAEVYSPNKGVKSSQSRPFLSFWLTSLCALPVLPIVCGTALRLRDLELIRSAAGRTDKLPIVVKDFPYLDQCKVEAILHFHFDLTSIPDTEVKRLAGELTGVFGLYLCFAIIYPSPLGRPRTLYEFIRRVAKASLTCELPTAAARLAFLNTELQALRKLMTESTTSSIAFRFFFEELLAPSEDVIPVVYAKEGGGIGNVLEDVASMVFQTLSNHKVEFKFSSERDFVNKGICMLSNVEYLYLVPSSLPFSSGYLIHTAKK